MIQTKLPIYLASKSPRRRKLLKQMNLKFKAFNVEMDEKIIKKDSPAENVKRLANQKLQIAKLSVKKGIIITADTIVVLNGEVIGKPKNKKDAGNILKKLSGLTHNVFTGVSVYNSEKNKTITTFEKTSVTFRALSKKDIDDYIATGSPMDKAGAYGIQDDFGAVFITKINGCYYNVVGLPVSKLYSTLLRII
ncbi:MAG: Maf family protein [Ignavibacteriaceae bacterium]|nr:Maf family protein [Ignavibacteriaceae bacterium]